MRVFKLQVSLFSLMASVAMIVGGSNLAWSQLTSGDLVGSVVDTSGAAIPTATVTVKNVATGVTTKIPVNAVGDYHFPNLLPGVYDVTGSAAGFSSYTIRNLDVQLNKTSTAKLTLPVAAVSTNIEVASEAPVVLDTTTTQLQTTFETAELQELPTTSTGWGVLNLTLLTPGVASGGGIGASNGPSVAGQRTSSNNYTIEGIDNNDKSVTGPLVYVPASAVGEFTAITTQFSPEFGHSVGGQFNQVVASGTNQFHGSMYEYMQNRNLNAVNAIEGGKTSNPRYDYNRYGGQLGGPIKKDKIFFFVNYERQTTGQSSQNWICTPTAAGMAALQDGTHNFNSTNLGVFTQYVPTSSAQVSAENDNACGNQETGDQYLTIYNDYAKDSSTGIYGSANPTQIPLGNYLVQAPNYINFNAVTTSGNWTISEKDSLRVRYIYNKQNGVDQNDIGSVLAPFYTTVPLRYHLVALSEYHSFTPNLTNEARLGYNRYSSIYTAGSFTFPGLDAFPNIYFTKDLGSVSLGPDSTSPQSTIQNLYQFTDNISWTKGRHSFKFGFDGRKYISPQTFTQRLRGDYEWKYLTEYLHDVAPTDFGERSAGNSVYYGDQTAFYFYANDTWRATNKLSLNYGVRYEFTSVPTGERTQALNSGASVAGLITFGAPSPQYTNFMPRVGFNYSPDANTSIRAGFSMGVDVLFDNLGILSLPPELSVTCDVGAASSACPTWNVGDPGFLASGGYPAATSGAIMTYDNVADQQAATSAFIPNQKLPYVENWSLGVQHVFHRDYTAEIRYVGNRGIHLPIQDQINIQPKVTASNQLPTYLTAPSVGELESLTNTLQSIDDLSNIVPAYYTCLTSSDPSCTNFTSKVTSYQPYSKSSYHGLAASLTRRMTHGLLLDAAFTWSKVMDDSTAPTYSTTLTPRRPQNSQDIKAEYSLSALSRKFRFTLAAVYDMPFFKNGNWLAKNLLGNWEIAPIYTYESPEFFTVISNVNSNMNGDSGLISRTIINPNGAKHTGTAVTAYANPNLVGSCPASTTALDPNGTLICEENTVAYVANDSNAYYVQAGMGTLPTAKRNSEPTRPINNFDATAVKRFNITDRYKVEFQAQAYNVFNHSQHVPGAINNINYVTQYVGNYQSVDNSLFNQPGKAFTANARTMQLALKFDF
jgi:hypothetical protein